MSKNSSNCLLERPGEGLRHPPGTPLHGRLTPRQSKLLDLTKRHGTRAVVGIITGVSVLLSLALTSFCLMLKPAAPHVVVSSIAIATVIPLLVAPVASYAISRLLQTLSNAYDELHVLASIDALTGIANRRNYFAQAAHIIANCGEDERTLVGMVDVDRFKQINDAHGHATGDLALVSIANRLDNVVGGLGIVGRVGGDEFALCVNVPSAQVAALRAALHEACTAIPLMQGLVVDASLGVFELDGAIGIDHAMSRADRTLYETKASRNQNRDLPSPAGHARQR